MKLVFLKSLTPERWRVFSFAEQMSNVGSEVFRSMRWHSKDGILFRASVDRALEFLDLTIDVSVGTEPRLRELTRLREALVDFFLYDNAFASTDRGWETHFGPFDHAASMVRASWTR